MKYKKNTQIVTLGLWYAIRISNDKIFIGKPTAQLLESWGFTLIEEHIPTAEELLEDARANKLAELDAYDNSDNVNSFSLNGVQMWLDAQTRQQLRMSIEAYKEKGIENVTKWFGGVQFTFPTATWLYMLNELEVYASEALNVTESHRAVINHLTTLENIEDYDFTVGYPQKVTL